MSAKEDHVKAKKKGAAPDLMSSIRVVEDALQVLDELSGIMRGCVRPETRAAFRLVLAAARSALPKRGTAAYNTMMNAGAAPGYRYDSKRGFVSVGSNRHAT
jgi:hypothetical protein